MSKTVPNPAWRPEWVRCGEPYCDRTPIGARFNPARVSWYPVCRGHFRRTWIAPRGAVRAKFRGQMTAATTSPRVRDERKSA